ncbi:MarR family transcriptional regulator [Longispora fulva]|uniref:DNA-binding MarR family transcriptional regulator n=1 Tax=Longispora fulva TaxID=619741 RepID=A0A8J7GJK1_9ACTN|nr:MarR family transcriptional regulator [Longispora fulva]MBG6138730.1 DNA-binding MarR family transcriptional regulator [Longispora fulva]GIG58224.1 MarR family transcriptional regulator [Longispora fulva]
MTDTELVNAWRGLLERYHATSCALDRELNEKHQLGVSEFEVLERLDQNEECMRIQELAASVHLSQSALSRVVARLERDFLVTREICATDRRGVYVKLTDTGAQRYTEALPTQRAVLADNLA